eukprot:scaffold1661_cov251-Pinguiococcus_pyrenoidosus.AAC.56
MGGPEQSLAFGGQTGRLRQSSTMIVLVNGWYDFLSVWRFRSLLGVLTTFSFASLQGEGPEHPWLLQRGDHLLHVHFVGKRVCRSPEPFPQLPFRDHKGVGAAKEASLLEQPLQPRSNPVDTSPCGAVLQQAVAGPGDVL